MEKSLFPKFACSYVVPLGLGLTRGVQEEARHMTCSQAIGPLVWFSFLSLSPSSHVQRDQRGLSPQVTASDSKESVVGMNIMA